MGVNPNDWPTWLEVTRGDRRAIRLYNEHYSAKKNRGWAQIGQPAQDMTLITPCGDALFQWIANVIPRDDGQEGVNCSVFRNTSRMLSSWLIGLADDMAWERWDRPRHFTYVDEVKTKKRRSKHAPPGKCFIEAGWRDTGHRSTAGLILLERVAA